jgi:hypothetical protein
MGTVLLLALAACAAPRDGRAGPGEFTIALGETARAGAVRVTPVAIVEESRCPAEVQCIQAGTVRVELRGSVRGRASQGIAKLGEPLELGGGAWTELVRVCPYPAAPGPIPARAYRFTFLLGEGPSPRSEPVLTGCPAPR